MIATRFRQPLLACIVAVLVLTLNAGTGTAGTADNVLFAPVTSIPEGGEASLEVANPSDQPAIAAAMLFAEPIACPPYSGGAVRVWCSGVIAPRGAWVFPANALSGTSSVVLLGLSTATGPNGRPIGELACDRLAGALGVDPSGTYRRVRLALETGVFEGTPLEGAMGPAVSATLVRRGAELTGGTATHPALGRADTGTEHVIGGLHSRAEGVSDFLYVQNAGLRCSSIDVVLDTGQACVAQDVPAGSARVIDVSGCAMDGERNLTVTIASSEPVAVVRETLLGSVPRRPLAARPDRLQTAAPPRAGSLLWLPALAAAPDGMSCSARLQVTHPGATGPGAVAVLLLQGAADAFCPPQSPGPSQVECSGLLRPGGSWDFLLPERNGFGSDAASAVLLSFSDARLAEIGRPANRDDLIASAMCSSYSMWVVGNPDNARRARLAFQSGSAFRGTPQAAAVGPALTAVVERTCNSERPGTVTNTYAGLPASLLTTLASDEAVRPYHQDLPQLAAEPGDTTVLYLQNAGIRCTSVEVRLSDGTVLREPSLAPDETLVVDLFASLGRPLTGLTGRISGDEPLAVIAENYNAAAVGGPALGAGPDPVEDPGDTLASRTTWLPVLRYVGWDDRCEPFVLVENPAAGDMAAVAILVAAGESSFCPPQAAGPLKVECTGLIRPGGSWLLHGEQIPAGAYGAAVWSFRSETASQLGVNLTELGLELAEDDTVADWMCENLFFGAVGDADDYRRFQVAYESGLDWAGVPMGAIAGPPLRVAVRRACQGPEPTGDMVETHYAGIGPTGLGTVGPNGSHRLALEGLSHDPAGLDSALYLQNAGHRCASIEISFSNGRECTLAALPPLETRFVHASACAGEGADPLGAVIVSSEPLAAVVEADADSEGSGDVADRPPEVRVVPEPKAGTMVHLPVLSTFGHARGCAAVVQVTNPGASPGPAIAVMVEWDSASPCREVPEGPELVECSGLIRPGGSWSFPAPGDLPSNPASAVVYSFSTRSTTEVGPTFVTDTAGDYLCEALFFGAIGSEGGYRAFRQAFEQGGIWKDADLRLAAGPALQVAVARACGRDPVHADSYAGLTVDDLASRQPDGTWLYSRGGLRGGSDGHGSILYVQNAGFGSAAIEARSSAGDVCPLPTLGAGASFPFYVEDCTGEGFAGSMSLTADQPLAVAAETLAQPLPARPTAPRGLAAEVIGGSTVRVSWWAGDESQVEAYRVLRQRQGEDMEVVTEPPVAARHGPSTEPCYVVLDSPGAGTFSYFLEVIRTDGSTSMPLRAEARVGSGPGPTQPPTAEPNATPSGPPPPSGGTLHLPWSER